MKNIFLILLMVFMIGTGYAVHPARKPFIQIKIDGKSYKNGDILTVTPGQKLIIGVELEGGRRDYCIFPETYADITSTAQILSRGKDGLTYLLNGAKAEWKLLNEDTRFSADEFVQVKAADNQSIAELTITNAKFSQSFVNFQQTILDRTQVIRIYELTLFKSENRTHRRYIFINLQNKPVRRRARFSTLLLS